MTGMRSWGWILLVVVIGLARGLLYAHVVPLWQGPDEPRHYEYARLFSELGRVPTRGDEDPAIEREILLSLQAHRFWEWTRQPTPAVLPPRLSDDPWLRKAGPQVGAESPLYYVVPALLLRVVRGVEPQARAIRYYSVALYGLTILAAALATRATFRGDSILSKGVPLTLALAPMPAFIGSIVNNDALANLAGALFFAVLGHLWGRRWGLAGTALIAGALALAVSIKRTTWFLVPTAAAALLIKHPDGVTTLWRNRRLRWVAGGAVLGVVAGLIWAATWRDPASLAGWRLNPGHLAARRLAAAAHSGHFGLLIEDRWPDQRASVSQVLPESKILAFAGRPVRAEAWIRPLDEDTEACLILEDGISTTFSCERSPAVWERRELVHTLAADATYLRVVLAVGARGDFAATGSFLADDVSLWADGQPLALANSGFEAAGSPLLTWAGEMASRLQWPAGLWHGWFNRASYRPEHLARYLLYVALAFAHFWGDFGWLQLPLPLGWYALFAGLSLFSTLGLMRAGARRLQVSGRELSSRDRWLLVLAGAAGFALLAVFLPMIGQRWQPQGRYLFPALVPMLTLLLYGLRSWLPCHMDPWLQRAALGGWILLLTGLDQTALWQVLYRAYIHPGG